MNIEGISQSIRLWRISFEMTALRYKVLRMRVARETRHTHPPLLCFDFVISKEQSD